MVLLVHRGLPVQAVPLALPIRLGRVALLRLWVLSGQGGQLALLALPLLSSLWFPYPLFERRTLPHHLSLRMAMKPMLRCSSRCIQSSRFRRRRL